MNPQDKVALVTGGAAGLGEATAVALQSAGARVVVADLASLASESQGAAFCRTDVTDEADVQAALDFAEHEFGPIYIVVNCAGVHNAARLVSKDGEPGPVAGIDATVRVNLLGTLNVLRLAASRMQANDPVDGERGVVVNTASIAAWDGQVGEVAYAASKAGVVGMTLPAARELSRWKIRVMAVAPGIFDTPMLSDVGQELRDRLSSAVPHPQRFGHPEEFAALVRHIVENPFLNGETIRLDGALRMPAR